MTADKGGPYESSAPDQYMERHVTDLRVTVGRFDERINDIRGTAVRWSRKRTLRKASWKSLGVCCSFSCPFSPLA